MADEILSAEISIEELKQFTSDMERARQSVEDLSKQSESASTSLKQMGEASLIAGRGLASINVGNFETLNAQVVQLSASIDLLRDKVSTTSESVTSMGDAALNFANQAEEMGKRTASAANESSHAADKMGLSWKRVVEVMLGFSLGSIVEKILGKIRDELKSTTELFEKQEDAVVSLGIAFSSMGNFSTDAVKSMQTWAKELQSATAFSDEAILSASALIAQLGRIQGDELKQATEAAVQLSSVLGRDLTASAVTMAKAAQGQIQVLSRLGFAIRDDIPQAEQFQQALQLINERLGGTAQLRARTMSGQVERLTAAWNDSKEAFGAAAAAWIPALTKMADGFTRFAEKVNPNFLRVFDTDLALKNLQESVVDLQKAIADSTSTEAWRGDMGAIGIAADQMADTVVSARERATAAFENFKAVINFKIQTGTAKEITEQIEAIKKAIPSEKDVERVGELLKLLNTAVVRLQVRTEFDRRQITADIRELRDEARRVPLAIEVSLLTDPVDKYLAELDRRRPEITAKMDLDADALKDIQNLSADVTIHAKELDDEQFTSLAHDARLKFIKAFEEAETPADWDKVLALGDLVRTLETLRIPKIPIEFEIQGPQFIEPDLGPVNRLEKELEFLSKRVIELQQLGGATPLKLLDLTELSNDVKNLEFFRNAIGESIAAIRASVNQKVAEIRLDEIQKLKQAGDDQIAQAQIMVQSAQQQAAAMQPLLEAYKILDELTRSYIETLGEVPEAQKKAIDNARASIDQFAKSWQPVNAEVQTTGQNILKQLHLAETASRTTGDALIASFKGASDQSIDIVKNMVDEILKQLARIAAFNIIKSIVGFFTGGTSNLIPSFTNPIPFTPKPQAPEEPVPPQNPFEIPTPEIPTIPPIEFAMPTMPEIPPIEFNIPNIPKIEPIDFVPPELPSIPPIEFATPPMETDNLLQDFTREIALGASENRQRPVEVIIRREDLGETVPTTLNVTLSGVNDGISVRRQMTQGALRRELLREARRGRL